MHLQLAQFFQRSRSAARNRSDLSSTPTDNPSALLHSRSARSDFFNAISLLDNILFHATQHALEIDRTTWTIEPQAQQVRRFHFEHLTRYDQMLCPTLCIEFTKHLKSLQARVDADALATMQGVVEQLARFAGAGEAVVREQAVCGGGPEDDDGGIIRETGRAGL